MESYRLVQGPLMPPIRNPRVRRVRRWLFALSIMALALVFLLLARHSLLASYARLFRVDDRAPSDVLVLLMGGLDYRPGCAAELYRRKLAPLVLICRTKVIEPIGRSESELTKELLIRDGVPPDAIVVVPGGIVESTRDEALRVRGYLESHPVKRLTVVTVSFHTARARRIFRRTLAGLGIDVRAAACTEPRFNETNWYKSESGLIFYFEETIKTVLYYFKY